MPRKILLTQGKYTLVDDKDYEWLNQWKWHITKKGYAARNYWEGKITKNIKMHRLILNTPINMQSDHINGNRLDNRRNNLRIVNQYQNQRNSRLRKDSITGYKGASWHKASNKWQSQIFANNQKIYLGLYLTKELAAKAYDKKAKELFGEFARLNVIKPTKRI